MNQSRRSNCGPSSLEHRSVARATGSRPKFSPAPSMGPACFSSPLWAGWFLRCCGARGLVGDRDVKVILDVVIVLVIVSIGGFFASAEMALVSLREGQGRSLAKRGRRGATAARLASDPNRFLASVQIGTTLATLVTGAYGAETLAGLLSNWLVRQGVG